MPEPTYGVGARFAVVEGEPADKIWTATYLGTLPSGSGWLHGDRISYRGAFGHLARVGFAEPPVGRFAFRRLIYSTIFDDFMNEGERNWDGSIYTGGGQQTMSPGEFEDLFEDQPAYVPLTEAQATGVPVPQVQYVRNSDGLVLENRNYNSVLSNPQTHADVRFRIEHSDPDRVVVVARMPVDGEYFPIVAVYYDSIDPSIHMESNLATSSEQGTVLLPVSDSQGNTVDATVNVEIVG